MLSQMGKLSMPVTTGASGSYYGPRGKPETTGDWRESYNIQNMLRKVVWPKPYQDDPEDRQGYGNKDERNQDIEQGKRVASQALFGIILLLGGGYIVWRMVR